jgi:carbonic anhydrase
MDAIDRLKQGYRDFAEAYFSGTDQTFKKLVAEGQNPDVLLIGCSDSRVSPCVITRAEPGEIFTIRNVANLVPPYRHEENGHHGVSAAIEFAVTQLEVRHIIVLGHSQCGGIQALLKGNILGHKDSFVSSWMDIAAEAKAYVDQHFKNASFEQKAYACEQAALRLSLNNLLTFPWVKQRVEQGKLFLHAWHFDLSSGQLMELTPGSDKFQAILN